MNINSIIYTFSFWQTRLQSISLCLTAVKAFIFCFVIQKVFFLVQFRFGLYLNCWHLEIFPSWWNDQVEVVLWVFWTTQLVRWMKGSLEWTLYLCMVCAFRWPLAWTALPVSTSKSLQIEPCSFPPCPHPFVGQMQPK